jgi:hypothetical protein
MELLSTVATCHLVTAGVIPEEQPNSHGLQDCVRKGERGDFIGQLLESCCMIGFQSLNRFPG